MAILLLREVGQSQSLITFVSSSTLPTTGRSSYFSPLSYSACKMISSASNNWASIQGGGKKTGILQSGCSQSHPPSPFLFLKNPTFSRFFWQTSLIRKFWIGLDKQQIGPNLLSSISEITFWIFCLSEPIQNFLICQIGRSFFYKKIFFASIKVEISAQRGTI